MWLMVVLSVVLADSPAEDPGVWRFSPTLETDLERREVRIAAKVVFREGPLELFLCPENTKEHESILAAKIEPKQLQTALLLARAKPGRPATFDPYRPPTGQPIDIRVEYMLGGKRRTVDAREWIRRVDTKESMKAKFVFAGSRLVRAPGARRPIFLADQGDVICVANFPGSIIDVDLRAPQENALLLFEAWTERIPPVDTPVTVVLDPVDAEQL